MSESSFEYETDDDLCGGGVEDVGDDEAILIENTFYEADDNKTSNLELALEQFLRVKTLEESRGDEVVWRFKALENIVILSNKLNRTDDMVKYYREMLSHMANVTRNDASESISNVLDNVSTTDLAKLETIYEYTLDVLKRGSNHRLYFSTSVKLAKLYLEWREVQKLQRLLTDLHKTCQKPDGTDDMSKSSHLLEVYALMIQMCTLTKNSLRMKEIYPKTINCSSAIADPRNVAVIRESGGKMYMSEKKWELAYNEFFEAFKNYQDAGNATSAKQMLQYVVIANMLALSSINPFDSREAKVYQDDPEMSAMADLRTAYGQNDIQTIHKMLTDPNNKMLSDEFIRFYLKDLLRNIRLQVLQHIIKPYRCVRLEFLAQEINVSKEEVVSLLVQLILDDKIAAQIDGSKGFLHVKAGVTEDISKAAEVQKWVSSFERIHSGLLVKLNQMP